MFGLLLRLREKLAWNEKTCLGNRIAHSLEDYGIPSPGCLDSRGLCACSLLDIA